MTSQINYTSINENFPVAGEDNDTQTFRDNFDTIKTSLQAAQGEITALQANTAKVNAENDFANNTITRAVFQNTMEKKNPGGNIDLTVQQFFIDYENGSYQIFKFPGVSGGSTPRSLNITFQNLPQNSNPILPLGVGKMRLELTTDGSVPGVKLVIITENGTTIKHNGFPNGQNPTNILLNGTGFSNNPVIIDVWRHGADNIFMQYIGQFTS